MAWPMRMSVIENNGTGGTSRSRNKRVERSDDSKFVRWAVTRAVYSGFALAVINLLNGSLNLLRGEYGWAALSGVGVVLCACGVSLDWATLRRLNTIDALKG